MCAVSFGFKQHLVWPGAGYFGNSDTSCWTGNPLEGGQVEGAGIKSRNFRVSNLLSRH